MRKRVYSLLMCALAVIGMCVPAGAHGGPDRLDGPQVQVISEYEELMRSLQSEASVNGISGSARQALVEYESSISQRAKLPEETLRSYGYTSEQIALLKAYDAGTLSFTEIAAATSAELTADLDCISHQQDRFQIAYYWNWDIIPVSPAGAAAALVYAGINASGTELSANLSSYESRVNYYYEYVQ